MKDQSTLDFYAREAEAYAAAGPHVRLRWAPGLGHRRILADAGVVADAVAFAGEAPASADPVTML